MNCPLCNSTENIVAGTKDKLEISLCENCGLYFVSPMPCDEELHNFYQDYEPGEVYRKKIYKKTLTAMAKILRAGFYIENNSKTFLDVGCNIGIVANAGRILGYQATGIDLDKVSINVAKDRFARSKFLASSPIEYSKTEHSFDLVFCTEVIEHTPHIIEFAKSLRKLTKTGGVLYLTTPDANHWKVPKDFVSWKEVKPPEHIIWFNKSNISRLLGDAGFEIQKIYWNHRANLRLIAKAV